MANKKLAVIFLKFSVLLMFIMFTSLSKTNETSGSEISTDVTTSGYYTPVQVVTFALKTQSGKMGSTTGYEFIGPSGERNPRFYSGIIAKVAGTKVDCIARLRIEVSGTDPNGNPLPSDRFINPSVLSSPDESSVEQEILKIIYNVLVSAMPYGLSEIVKYTQSAGGAKYGWTENYAYGEWYFTGVYQERGLRYGFDLRVYPDVEGKYTIKIHYLTEFSLHSPLGNFPRIEETYDTLTYQYVNKPLTPPQPSGPTAIYLGKSYTYTTSTIDPNGDMLRYEFNWDDGTVTRTDWYPSGVTVSASHVWSVAKDKYYVKVRAQDNTGTWSDWSPALTVNRLCNLTISVSGLSGSTGVKIWVDGTPYTAYVSSPVKITVTAGQHTIEAEKVIYAGYATYLFSYWLDGTIYTANPLTIQIKENKLITAYYHDP